MDATTEIWTLRPRNRRNDQEMDITTKTWTLQPRYGRMTKLLTLRSRNGRQRLRYDNFFEKYRLLKTVVIKKDEITKLWTLKTKIWTLRPRYGRFNQDMDITTKIWTLQIKICM